MKIMKKGFTLLELLMVIMVIAILIGIALPRFKGMVSEGNIAKAKGELRTLQIGVESYYMHNSNIYPATLSQLTTQNPLIVATLPTDPFAAAGANYGYIVGGTSSKSYAIYSIGPLGTGAIASITTGTPDTLNETAPTSCIYVSNLGQDTQP